MNKDKKEKVILKSDTSKDATYYQPSEKTEEESCHTFLMIARDRAGTLARVTGLFSARNYNIDNMTAANVDPVNGISCITLTTRGSEKVLDQIHKQLENLINVCSVTNISAGNNGIIRELALIKICAEDHNRVEALSIARSFGATIVDAFKETIILEIAGNPTKVDSFIDIMRPLGIIEIVKSGATGMINGNVACSFTTKAIEDSD